MSLDAQIQVGGAHGSRGVLKAALHFCASQTDNYENARSAAISLAPTIFSDTNPDEVRLAPYDSSELPRGHEFHDVIAFTNDTETIVRVNLFNVVSFLVKLPRISLPVARQFIQNTRNGEVSIGETSPLKWKWEDGFDDPPDRRKFQKEFDERVARITQLGLSKRYILAIIDTIKSETHGYEKMLMEDRRTVLVNAVKERLESPILMTPWMADALKDFTIKRIINETRA